MEDPELEELRRRIGELTPSPGWSRPVELETDPDIELLRKRVREMEIKLAREEAEAREMERESAEARAEVERGERLGRKRSKDSTKKED